MANISIGPSKRNFIVFIIPKWPSATPIVAQSNHHCQYYCARWCYFLDKRQAYAAGMNRLS